MPGTMLRASMGILIPLTVVVLPGWAALAGELEPPVPPGTPTMKSLNEVEPRQPIYPDMLPLTIYGEGSSWYLAEHIDVTTGGITVYASDVTIDLMGHKLTGHHNNGPAISAPYTGGVTVRNGTIVGWDKGLALNSEATVVGVRVYGANYSCIELNYDSQVIDSMAVGCGDHGIVVGSGSLVRGCIASGNIENGIWAKSLQSGTYQGSLIVENVVQNNLRNGIRVDGHSTVLNNQIRGNDQIVAEGKAGVWVYGEGNRIEGNHIAYNNIGIDLDGHENIIIKNSLVHNLTAAYSVDPSAIGNVFEIGTGPTAGPWANFCKGTGCPP